MNDQLPTPIIFSEEAHKNFAAFGTTLGKIHRRLVIEGYEFRDGKIIPPMRSKADKHGKMKQ